jgi:predicted aspartyl protease
MKKLSMGEFNWPIGVWSAGGERMETVDALVDTGASYSMFPRGMLERLGIERRYVLPFEQADGSVVDRDVGRALLVINGAEDVQRVIFGEDDSEPLIGAGTLQGLLLVVDSVSEELVRRTGRLK